MLSDSEGRFRRLHVHGYGNCRQVPQIDRHRFRFPLLATGKRCPDGAPGADIEEQTRFAFQNVARVLEMAGGSMADVVELTTYHIAMDELPKVAAVKAEFVPENFPAWTAVGVTQLALPEMLVEVKATAVIGSGL